jgi:hypothetical protein
MNKDYLKGIVIGITLFFSAIFFIKTIKDENYYCCDVIGYYSYIPSAFIYHNFHQIDSLPLGVEERGRDYALSYREGDRKSPTGFYVNQYTYGVAFFEVPFFVLAHIYEKINHLSADGYSINYYYSLKISSIFYSLLGFFFLYKTLKRWYSETFIIIGFALLFLGSNLYWFTLFQVGMSHPILFFLYALLMNVTVNFYENKKLKYLYLIALICGFITIIRPVEIICITIPLLYEINSIDKLKSRFYYFFSIYKSLLLSGFVFILPIIPQIILWKKYTGKYLYNSYLHQSFNWLKPHLFDGIFGSSNGWLFYSPIFIFAIIGIYYLKNNTQFKTVILILIPLHIYITYSWWCYNYIFGFGSRPMIHMYPILLIGLMAFLLRLKKVPKVLAGFIITIFLFFIFVNIKWSIQSFRGDLTSENSNYLFNIKTLFKLNLSYDDLLLYENATIQANENNLKYKHTIITSNYKDSSFLQPYLLIEKGDEFTKAKIAYHFRNNKNLDGTYIKCIGKFNSPIPLIDLWNTQQLVFELKRNDSSFIWQSSRINNKIGKLPKDNCKDIHLNNVITNQWGEVYFFIKMPNQVLKNDIINLSVWNIAKEELKVEYLKMEEWQE